MLKLTKVFEKNANAYTSQRYKYIINQGGSSSSKTFSILQLLTIIAQSQKLTIDIASESLPHLKRGVLRDFLKIFEQFNLNFDLMFNRSDSYLTFENGTKINFIALDSPGKARGSRRDILFINEANLIPYDTAAQLFIRTHSTIFIDYNPTNAFWVHNKTIANNPTRYTLIKSTYLDNQFLTQGEIDELESHKGNNNFWRVYGLGELGLAEGLIFDNVEPRNVLDKEIRQYDYIYEGIDWGYEHPFVFLKIYYNRDKQEITIYDEIYGSHLSDNDIDELLRPKHVLGTTIIADSEDLRSNEEFINRGFPIQKAVKGAGSVDYGFKKLRSLKKIYIDPNRCPNTYKEFTSYSFLKDKNGDYRPDYPRINDDAIAATRYALEQAFSY